MLSESQERMLMVCEPNKWPRMREIFDKWGLESEIIGEVTSSGRVEVVFENHLEVDLQLPISQRCTCLRTAYVTGT